MGAGCRGARNGEEVAVTTLTEPEAAAWCDGCEGPVVAMSLSQCMWSRFCWFFIVHLWPAGWLYRWPGWQMLPSAGSYAFRCHCRKARAASKLRRKAGR